MYVYLSDFLIDAACWYSVGYFKMAIESWLGNFFLKYEL